MTANGASPPNSATERSGGGHELIRAKSEDNLSETEEAAMTLEDIGESASGPAPGLCKAKSRLTI